MKYKEELIKANLTIMESWNIVYDLVKLIDEKGLNKPLGNKDVKMLKGVKEYLNKPLYNNTKL